MTLKEALIQMRRIDNHFTGHPHFKVMTRAATEDGENFCVLLVENWNLPLDINVEELGTIKRCTDYLEYHEQM